MRILDAQTILNEKIEKGYTEKNALYYGDMKANTMKPGMDIVPGSEKTLVLKNKTWEGSESYAEVWNKIEDIMNKVKRSNIASFDSTSYYELVDALRVDITRRRMARPDLTALMDIETMGPGDSYSVTLRELLPYGAAFKENNLRGAPVAMIDPKYGGKEAIIHQGYALGWAETLERLLYYTDLDEMQKITEAVARAYVGLRNDLSVGTLPAKTTAGGWDSGQQVAAATTSGWTPDELLYATLNSAIEKLTNLKDPQTGQLIDTSRIYMLVHRGDVRRISRVTSGQLNNSKGVTANRTALTEIDAVIPYDGDVLYVGEEKITYPGVAKNKAYMYVPAVASYTRVKRGLTQEVGRGNVLNLSQTAMAWYCVQTAYRGEFFGSSDAAVYAALGSASGYGFVIEITLPAA